MLGLGEFDRGVILIKFIIVMVLFLLESWKFSSLERC